MIYFIRFLCIFFDCRWLVLRFFSHFILFILRFFNYLVLFTFSFVFLGLVIFNWLSFGIFFGFFIFWVYKRWSRSICSNLFQNWWRLLHFFFFWFRLIIVVVFER